MIRRHPLAGLLLALLALALAACAQLTPTTFNQRLAAGYTASAAVADGTVALLNANRISVADAKNVKATNDTAIAGLDAARQLAGTDLYAADTKLTATIAVLTALQTYLATKKGTP